MNQANSHYRFACGCGANSFRLSGEPAMRAVCHCHHCQEYNQSAYGDFLVYRKSQLVDTHEPSTAYRAFSKPPMVKRGSCRQCGKPVLERVNIPLFPELIFVPVVNHPDKEKLGEPVLQMFTHRRIKNPGEHIKSYTGYFGSEVPFVWKLMQSLWRTKA